MKHRIAGRMAVLAFLIMILAGGIGETGAEAAVKKVSKAPKASAKEEVWYSYQYETYVETDKGKLNGIEVWASDDDIKGGKIRKDAISGPVKEGELKAASETGYYVVPAGYQVAANTELRVVRMLPEGMSTDQVCFYEKKAEKYTEINFTDDIKYKYVKFTEDVTLGCDWKVTKLSITDYKSATQNQNGEELAGTPLQKGDFTVEAELANGETVAVKPADFTITPGSIPLKKSQTCKVTAALVRHPHMKADWTIKVTEKRFLRLEASCKKDYHVGETIKLSDIDLYVISWDVVNDKEVADKVKDLDFTLSPETIMADGVNPVTVTYQGNTAICEVNGYGVREITASYTGKDVVVGNEFDTTKVKVTVVYNDNTKKVLKPEEFSFGSTRIAVVGENQITVIYGAYTTTFSVNGVERAVEKIEAEYVGKDVIVGGSFQASDVKVTAYFNDGTEEKVFDFLLSTTVVSKKGGNKITVTYKDKITTITVVGAEKQPVSITAIYHGEPVVAGSDINMNDVEVTAYYNDGTYGVVTDFSLTLTTLTAPGMNMVTVVYKNVTTTIYVICIMREATALEAVYKGPDIHQNSSFNRDYVIVTATFNDGSVEQVTDFVLASTVVPKLGVNNYQVTYGTKTARFTVNGIARTITGTQNMEADISNEDYEGITLTAELTGQQIKENMSLDVEVYETKELSRVVRKTTKSNKFIGFELDADGYEFVENQYMTARITVPADFDPAKVAVYFTPNRKTVMARMAGGLVAPDVYEFYIYRSGTYVLLESDTSTLKDRDLRGDVDTNGFIIVSGLKPVVKVGEKLNLSAVVVPVEENVIPSFSWRVDDTDIAKVTSNGVFLAKESGYVELTVKTKDGKLSYTCEIEVVDKK